MSGKHASVKDGTVYVNGKKFIKPAATYSMSSAERSYFVLGNLAAAYQNGHSKQPATFRRYALLRAAEHHDAGQRRPVGRRTGSAAQ